MENPCFTKGSSRRDGRGGARAGAGRKPKSDRICPIGYKITELAKENLRQYAESRSISMADALNQILEEL